MLQIGFYIYLLLWESHMIVLMMIMLCKVSNFIEIMQQ